jgi:cysteine synthase A
LPDNVKKMKIVYRLLNREADHSGLRRRGADRIGGGGIKNSFDKAAELIAQYGYFEVRQFENPHNPEIHRRTTGPEIEKALAGKIPDALVAGIGTGGTITGAGAYLREKRPDIRIVAVEPDASPVLSGGEPGPHAIQGIGAGIIPGVLNTRIYDEIIRVTNDEAVDLARRLAAKEGLFLGYSSAAAIFAAIKTAEKLGAGKRVVTVAPDTGERYLSTPLYRVETGADSL